MDFTSEGNKITSAEVKGRQFEFENPVPLKKAGELQEKLEWLSQYLDSEAQESEEWTNTEIKSFIDRLKEKDKKQQLLFLKFLADNEMAVKEDFDQFMQKSNDDWSTHSLGGLKGSLVQNMENYGGETKKEKLFNDRKNSELPKRHYTLKDEYRDVIEDSLQGYTGGEQ
jgi:hypothetical protein